MMHKDKDERPKSEQESELLMNKIMAGIIERINDIEVRISRLEDMESGL